MANGRVTTGFSKPYVALYTATSGSVTYASGAVLARGVNVSITPDDPGDNNFYADNIVAETAAQGSGTGEITLTVDGLKDAANKLIFGLPTADSAGWIHYGISQSIPYVGIGFVIRVQEDQAVSYVPCIIRKASFSEASTSAATQEDSIDWQTQELTAKYMRDDTTSADWKWLGESVSTEAAAEAKIKTVFSIS